MMLMTAIHRHPWLMWPLLALSTVLLVAGALLVVA
jgi:hypothetical protein